MTSPCKHELMRAARKEAIKRLRALSFDELLATAERYAAGYKLVPDEPNEAMKVAGWKASEAAIGCFNHEHGDTCPHCGDGYGQPDGCGNQAVKAYKAMVEASQGEK